MSEAEFESYLSLLSKFLKLRAGQQAELADELRDHLDSRLDELIAQGKSRDEAVRIALDEFGDAAVLAEDFSRLASRRKRRFVMRCTAASAVVVGAVVLLSVAFAPPGPDGPGPQHVIAQQTEDAGPVGETQSGGTSIEQQAIARLDRKLGEAAPPMGHERPEGSTIFFADVPLDQALTIVADEVEIDFVLDRAGIEDEGIAPDEPVSLFIGSTPVTVRAMLEFLLEPVGLTFVNRSGILYVTTEVRADEHLTTKVYNVRDLLENATSHTIQQPVFGGGLGGGGMGGGGGFFSLPDATAAAVLAGSAGQIGTGQMDGSEGGMGGGVGVGFGTQSILTGPAAELVETVQQTTSGPWMEIDGAGGTMNLFNGLLVVRQTDEVHAQIDKLLDALREADRKQPGDSVTVPKEGEPQPASDQSSRRTRDLSVLSNYQLSPDARAALLAAVEAAGEGPVTELSTLRGVTLSPLPSQFPGTRTELHSQVIEPMGVTTAAWREAIEAASSQDRPINLEHVLAAAKILAQQTPSGDITANHLLASLVARQEGPIPAVLAHVGLSTRAVRNKALPATSSDAPGATSGPFGAGANRGPGRPRSGTP